MNYNENRTNYQQPKLDFQYNEMTVLFLYRNKYILLDSLMWNMAGYFYESRRITKYKLTSKNIRPYSTSNCLISDLFSNEFKTYIKEKKFEDKI